MLDSVQEIYKDETKMETLDISKLQAQKIVHQSKPFSKYLLRILKCTGVPELRQPFYDSFFPLQ